ncbi:MAG: hypothetical protein ACI81W_002738, partial [Saprospiraceae bacterium]
DHKDEVQSQAKRSQRHEAILTIAIGASERRQIIFCKFPCFLV